MLNSLVRTIGTLIDVNVEAVLLFFWKETSFASSRDFFQGVGTADLPLLLDPRGTRPTAALNPSRQERPR